jgi:neutral ceramidase
VSAQRFIKRVLVAIAVSSAAALVLFATISLGHKPSPLPQVLGGRRASQATGVGELRAGAARVELSMPSHGPVAGYPMWRRDDGTGEPIFVRALVLEQGDLHAVILSLPLLLIPGDLEEAIVHRASLGESDCLLAAATHTHSGPGGTWKNLLLEVGGNGLFKQARVDAVAKAAADAIALARSRLGPAHFATGLETWTAGPAVPRSGEIDSAFAAARLLDSDNRTVASILVYAMHATVVPRSEHKLSGDWPEAAARQIEEVSDRAPALVLQGAEGSATFSRAQLPEDPLKAAEQLGGRIAAEGLRVISGGQLFPSSTPLSCTTKIAALPEPQAGRAVWRPFRRAAGNLLRLYADRSVVGTTLELPGLALIGVPAEPVGGFAIAERRAHGGRAMLVGLADGYAGYVETPAHWQSAEGESARTWYGPDLAAALGLTIP